MKRIIFFSSMLALILSLSFFIVNAETKDGTSQENAVNIVLDEETTVPLDFDEYKSPYGGSTLDYIWFVFQPEKAELYDMTIKYNDGNQISCVGGAWDTSLYYSNGIYEVISYNNNGNARTFEFKSTSPFYIKISVRSGCTKFPSVTITKHKHIWNPTEFGDDRITYYCSVCGEYKHVRVYPWLSCTKYYYDGKIHQPTLSLKGSGASMLTSDDYKVSFPKASSAIGAYKVRVVYLGDYSWFDPVDIYYYISPKGTSITKLSRGRKQLTVKWKKQNKNITGYTVRISTNSKFSSYKIKYVSKKTTSKTFTKLKAKKTYYVQVSTYKKVKGKNIYSGWSSTKKIKTK